MHLPAQLSFSRHGHQIDGGGLQQSQNQQTGLALHGKREHDPCAKGMGDRVQIEPCMHLLSRIARETGTTPRNMIAAPFGPTNHAEARNHQYVT